MQGPVLLVLKKHRTLLKFLQSLVLFEAKSNEDRLLSATCTRAGSCVLTGTRACLPGGANRNGQRPYHEGMLSVSVRTGGSTNIAL